MTTSPPDPDDPAGTVTTPDPGPRLIGAAHQDAHLTQAGHDLTTVQRDQNSAGRDLHIHPTTVVQQPLSPSGLHVRYSLPGDVTAFTGRGTEVAAITTVVEQAGDGGGVVTIYGATVQAIDGMPGVGKTALAVHAAHQVKDRYPDRCLFIDLHAHTPGQTPTTPLDALAGLLTAVGVDPRHLPADLDGRIGLWRDRMAGQHALLVLDNATDSRQVTPLLPGSPGCLVLVTSRRYLGDLDAGARILSLDVLPADQARALFVRLAPRAVGEPAAVGHIVNLAGHLPLAISLLARVYSKHPTWTLHTVIEQTRRRLLTVRAENTTIAAAFDLSYATLTSPQRRLFTLLGLHPGTEVDDHAAAALADIPLDQAADLLDDLHSARLLTEPPTAHPGRYGMHDLIRTYIHDRATTLPATDRDQALDRLLDYYQHVAARADTFLTRYTRPAPARPDTKSPVAAQDLPDHTRALEWARTERGNLLACLDHVTTTGRHARIVALTAALVGLLRQDGPWTEAITRHATAAEAAHHTHDRLGQARALNDLGDVRRLTGDYPQATTLLEQALTLFRDLGDRRGQARALNDLGVVRYLTDDYPQATTLQKQALTLFRDLGDRRGQAHVLNDLGVVRYMTGDYPQATTLLEQALTLFRDLGDRRGQARALNNLGIVQRRTGHYPQATTLQKQALTLYRDLGHRRGQAHALKDLGIVQRLTGDYPQATTLQEQALTLYRSIGNRGGEAEVLNEVGTLHRVRGNLDQAVACHRQAVGLARQIHSVWDEAHALAGLARCALATGHTRDARAGLGQAWEIFQRIGAAEAAEVAAELAALGCDLQR